MRRVKYFEVFALVFLILTLIGSLSVGSTTISMTDSIISLIRDTEYSYIIRKIRLQRVFGSTFCGGILALSGVAFQTSFKNELADPYLLGVSSGASLSIAIATMIGLVTTNVFSLPILAFVGAIIASAIAVGIDYKTPQTIILSGVAVSSLFSALTSFLIYMNRNSLSGVYFWTMGSFSSLSLQKMTILLVTMIIEFNLLHLSAKSMDILLLDHLSARSLGVNPIESRVKILLISAISTSIAVSFCGVIGFTGIVSPHIARKIVGPSHKNLLFSSMIVGAWIMTIADTISRTVLAPAEIPVGIITSIIGCPLFLVLAIRGKKK